MSKFRRIGTTSLQYGSPWVGDGPQRERDLVLGYIARAGEMGVDILLFQESFTFFTRDPDRDPKRRWFSPTAPEPKKPPLRPLAERCMSLDDPYVARVRDAAKQAQVNVILPLFEQSGNFIYNSLVPVTSQGALLRPYRKMFPVGGGAIDGEVPGENNEAQLIADVPVSFSICFDIHFDEVFDAARNSGARLVFWSSMWMGGLWLVAQAVRNGIYIVSATPDGHTFVDMDGTILSESHNAWPQTAGHNVLVFEDLNFDRDVFHCWLDGKGDAVREKYGEKIHMRTRSQDSIVVIESLDPEVSIEAIKQEFDLKPWYEYIRSAREARNRTLDKAKAVGGGQTAG